MKDQILHTPEGVRDIINGECLKKRKMIDLLMNDFYSFGYQPIETPTFEYFDVFGKEVGTTPSRELYKLFDKEGDTIVLRPDFTPGVARAASRYFDENDVLRLCYEGNVFVNSDRYRGNLKESTQLGAEFINDPSLDADAEIIAMVVSVLKKSGLKEFQISIGHADIFKGLCQAAGFDEDEEDIVKNLIDNKNFFGAEEFLDEKNVDNDIKELFSLLYKMFPSPDDWKSILNSAEKYPLIKNALSHLYELDKILKMYGVDDYISFELGLVSPYKYYTGIIFNGYTFGTGEPVIRGGRYDKLLKYFRSQAPAIGFAVMLDSLLSAVSRQKEEKPVEQKLTVILYTPEKKKSAIEKAVAMRNSGNNVLIRSCENEKELSELKTKYNDKEVCLL